MKLKLPVFAILLILFAAFWAACTKPTPFGSELLADELADYEFTDTLSITCTVEMEDSLLTSDPGSTSSAFLCGELDDPIFGKSKAEIFSLLQMSVDNMEPNEFSQKSWSQIGKKLELLKAHARFGVNINAVLGSSNLEQTRQVVQRVKELGFFMTVGLMHDERGQIEPGLLKDDLATVYQEMQRTSNKTVFHQTGEGWEWDMLQDGSSPFKCRAGGRYLYVDEFGLVNYCSQRRGEPGTDVLAYTADDCAREFYTTKGCEAQCTIGCVRRASAFDGWRAQRGA